MQHQRLNTLLPASCCAFCCDFFSLLQIGSTQKPHIWGDPKGVGAGSLCWSRKPSSQVQTENNHPELKRAR